MSKVLSGLDQLIDNDFANFSGERIAVLANQASVSLVGNRFIHLVDALHQSKRCKLQKIFAPEHGFRGELQDMEHISHAVDARTSCPIVSLYGSSLETLAPKESDLKDLDLLIVDLPDIGSRYYTFAQSLAYAMEVAKKVGLRVMVLDRPNPINGSTVEGCGLIDSCRSFCGYAAVPQRHGLTLGELARLMNEGLYRDGKEIFKPIDTQLEVLCLTGWDRQWYQDETGLPWVIPSPNMPTLDTAIVYPGACLIEATQISEARGTTRPFEFFGAPQIDCQKWEAALAEEGIPLEGAYLRELSFVPQFQKHARQYCTGFQLHVQDRGKFQPLRWYLALLFSLRRSQAERFALRNQAYEFIKEVPAIDLLWGNPNLRLALERGEKAASLLEELEDYENYFKEERKKYLLY